MHPPVDYEPSENDIFAIQKIREIVENGNNAEVKRAKDGSLKIYEVKKKAV